MTVERFLDRYDVLLLDIGAVKLFQIIFQDVIDRLCINPSKLVYKGDSISRDVAGAKKAGISAIWINSSNSYSGEIQYQPGLMIGDLTELLFV